MNGLGIFFQRYIQNTGSHTRTKITPEWHASSLLETDYKQFLQQLYQKCARAWNIFGTALANQILSYTGAANLVWD